MIIGLNRFVGIGPLGFGTRGINVLNTPPNFPGVAALNGSPTIPVPYIGFRPLALQTLTESGNGLINDTTFNHDWCPPGAIEAILNGHPASLNGPALGNPLLNAQSINSFGPMGANPNPSLFGQGPAFPLGGPNNINPFLGGLHKFAPFGGCFRPQNPFMLIKFMAQRERMMEAQINQLAMKDAMLEKSVAADNQKFAMIQQEMAQLSAGMQNKQADPGMTPNYDVGHIDPNNVQLTSKDCAGNKRIYPTTLDIVHGNSAEPNTDQPPQQQQADMAPEMPTSTT